MIGRPRKPTQIKAMQGTLHKYRMNPAEPTPAVEVPPMPKEFRGREAGREYRRVTGVLKGMRTVARGDRGIIAVWCIGWENLMASYSECARSGLVIKGTKNGVQLSPFLMSISMAAKQLRTIAPELGLTPASRSRVTATPEPKKPDKFERFLEGKLDEPE
jgi:P27 family predicted phage terminase small subunit